MISPNNSSQHCKEESPIENQMKESLTIESISNSDTNA
jgi:hypothetical protein